MARRKLGDSRPEETNKESRGIFAEAFRRGAERMKRDPKGLSTKRREPGRPQAAEEKIPRDSL
jgi:hypothetical protein|tara:strand:- start:1972 stop:2160 length:189 start_codon:yes stop_codon:yes gene_type:complete